MRIVQVPPGFTIGGTEKAGCVLAEGLGQAGHEAHVVGREPGPRYEQNPPHGVKHHLIEEPNDQAYAKAILALDPDVVHLHGPLYDEPLIHALHKEVRDSGADTLIVVTPVFGRPPKDMSVLGECRTCLIGVYMLYRMRLWMNMSAEQAMRRGVGVVRINSFQQTDPPYNTLAPPEDMANRRRELGVTADSFVVGRIGRDTPGKWSPDTEQLVNALLESDPRVAWLSIGYPGEERGRERLKGRWGDRFVNHPQTADFAFLAKTLSAMDAQVFFSPYGECFSTTICEAAGCGTPTIAGVNPLRDNGQTEQIIDGLNGYLAATPGQAVEQVRKLLSSPELLSQMKRDTYDYAHARWTTPNIVSQLLTYYEACRLEDPLSSDYLQGILAEEREFAANYQPRMLRLLANGPLDRLRWRLTLAAVANKRLHSLGVKFKRWLK